MNPTERQLLRLTRLCLQLSHTACWTAAGLCVVCNRVLCADWYVSRTTALGTTAPGHDEWLASMESRHVAL